ncbi:MAG TPA: hypothetical protein VGX70_20445 [Gemmataceae bacterium]|nr:hypothetical protein [Gemmataceae bacterium]
MKRPFLLLSLLLAGCSTAPVADLMDYFSPGRMGPEATPPYGGVSAPHPGGGSLPSGAVVGPALPPVPPAPPAGGAGLTGPIAPPPSSSFGPSPAPPAPY